MSKPAGSIKLTLKMIKEIHRLARGYLGCRILLSVLSAFSPFITIYLSAKVIDMLYNGDNVMNIIFIAAIGVIAGFICNYTQDILRKYINTAGLTYFWPRYQFTIGAKMMQMDYESVENPEVHRLKQSIADYESFGYGINTFLSTLTGLINSTATIIFSISLTFSLFIPATTVNKTPFVRFASSPLGSVLFSILIFLYVFVSMKATTLGTKKQHSIMSTFTSFTRNMSYYQNNILDSYRFGKDIRLYNQKDLILHEGIAISNDARKQYSKMRKSAAKYANITDISSITVNGIIYAFVALKAIAGAFGVGSIIKFVGSINKLTEGLAETMRKITYLKANKKAIQAYFDYMEYPLKMCQGRLPIEKRKDSKYIIEFRNVSFKYPETGFYALKNISLKLSCGRLAVVGMNGSGKTTFIKLLCRLYDPTEGEILLNGTNIKEYDYNDYRSIFSVVFQDFKLFSYSLGQNLASKADYDEQKVAACLEKAGFGERYNEMSKGAKTCLYRDFEEDGVEISGGEAQKIALARALYKDAPLIILDEPTAALDPIAEYEVFSKFNEIVGEKTAIFISHRLSSCRFCDDIAVFHDGEIIQKGSHDELIKNKNGKYYELWHEQAHNYI